MSDELELEAEAELGADFGSDLGSEAEPVEAPSAAPNIDVILGIPVSVQVVLGGTTMPVADLIKLNRGAVIPLDQRVGQPVDVVVNGRIVARGEMVVIDEDGSRLGVSLTEVVSQAGTPSRAA